MGKGELFEIQPWEPGTGPPRYSNDVRGEIAKIRSSQGGRLLLNALAYHGKTVAIRPYTGQDCNAETFNQVDGALVLFTPGLLRGTPCAAGGGGASLPHEILHHELVHALRKVSGRDKVRGPRLSRQNLPYLDAEEFFAVLATNIFISDSSNVNKSQLRGSSFNHEVLDGKFA